MTIAGRPHPHRRAPFARRDKTQQLIQLAAARVSINQLSATFATPVRTLGAHLAGHAAEIRQRRRTFLLQLGASIGLTLPEIARLTGLPHADVRRQLTALLDAEDTPAQTDRTDQTDQADPQEESVV